jgi:hypothetical protein
MRHARVDDDDIGRAFRTEIEAIRHHDIRLRPVVRKVRARPLGERRIDLHSGDHPITADDVRKDRAVVAGADADMHHVLARGETELVVGEGPQARLAIVESACLVDCDQHVVVKVTWIGILRRPVFAQVGGTQQPPRARSCEMLARHRGERLDDGR